MALGRLLIYGWLRLSNTQIEDIGVRVIGDLVKKPVAPNAGDRSYSRSKTSSQANLKTQKKR